MNPFVKASQLKTKMPGYAVARMHALNHQTLQHLASHHREKFLKAFKYVQANVISSITVSRGIASCKHDGISSYFYWEKGQSPFVFHMPACAVEVGLPAAEELGAALERNGNTSALLACELAVGGARSHSYDVIRLVNSPGSRAELERLHLVTLDVIILDKQEKQGLGYDERAKLLQSLPQTQKAHCPDFQEVNGLDHLNAYYKRQIDKGEEGIVLHDLTTRVAYKIKPKFNLDLAIVGYVEGTEELTGNVVSIMGALVSGNSHQLVSRVQDLETKKADLQTQQAEYEQAYGDSSYHVRLDQAVPGASSLPTLSGHLDPLTQAAMLSAAQARQNSSDIQLQNQLFYAALTNDGTMLDRASLRTAQEAGKTRALNEMREVINNRQTLRAAQRNEAARKQYDQEKIDQARNNIPQQ